MIERKPTWPQTQSKPFVGADKTERSVPTSIYSFETSFQKSKFYVNRPTGRLSTLYILCSWTLASWIVKWQPPEANQIAVIATNARHRSYRLLSGVLVHDCFVLFVQFVLLHNVKPQDIRKGETDYKNYWGNGPRLIMPNTTQLHTCKPYIHWKSYNKKIHLIVYLGYVRNLKTIGLLKKSSERR